MDSMGVTVWRVSRQRRYAACPCRMDPGPPMPPETVASRRIVILLGLLTGIGAIAIDMALPAIPAMAEVLESPISVGQQIVGVFILGVGLGQLPAGVISDRVGRLPVLMAGMTIFTAAGAVTVLATSMDAMLVARFVQGLGASTGLVIARAVVRDISSGAESARILSLMVAIFTFAPMVAPVIGGFLVEHFDWRAPFAFVSVIGVLLLIAARLILPETGRRNSRGHFFRQLWNSSLEFASHRRSVLGVLLIVLPSMGFMPVLSFASALIIDLYGFTPAQFGFVFALAGLSILTGALLNRRLLLRFGTIQLIGIGAGILGVAGLSLAVIAWQGAVGFWWVWGSVCLYTSGVSFIAANATAMALDPVPEIAGAASSIIGTLQNVFGALSAIAAGLLYNGTVASCIIMMAVFGLLTFSLFLGRGVVLRDDSDE